MKRDRHIYKVLTLEEWTEFETAQNFAGSFLDKKDGFIHLSAGSQLQGTLDKYYTSGDDLVLAAVMTDALSDHIKWEASRGGAEFPHYYAVLQMEHLSWHKRLEADTQGRYDIRAYLDMPKT